MPCNWIQTEHGMMHVRTSRAPRRRCVSCRVAPLTDLICDFPIDKIRRGKQATCDKRVCANCRIKIGDLDICPMHKGETAECRSCHAPVIWLAHKTTGKKAPIDAEPSMHGNIRIKVDAGLYKIADETEHLAANAGKLELYTNHFQTCPYAEEHKRQKIDESRHNAKKKRIKLETELLFGPPPAKGIEEPVQGERHGENEISTLSYSRESSRRSG